MENTISIDVVDASGKKIRSRALDGAVFDVETAPTLLHQVVRWQRNRWRAGTHSVQTRAEMKGGGRKPWKQKGTGAARAGSNTSPLWVGGGIAHGPKVRSYEFRMNKEERRKALCSALSARCKEGRLAVVDSFGLSAIKTKDAQRILDQLGVERGKRCLVVLDSSDEVVWKSFRNITGATIVDVAGVNVYDVVTARHVVVLDAALEKLQVRLQG